MSSVTEPTTTSQGWLSCKLDKGMFSDEVAVTYPPTGSNQKSVFVLSSDVKGSPGSLGKVLVRIVTRGGHKFAVLPSANRDIVTVQQKDVSET